MKYLADKFMKIAYKESLKGMRAGDGGPFGAVIVLNGKVVAKGHNKVIKTNDPTNHAEVVAIRKAAKKLGRFDLSDCEIYTSCEPCPMCLSAIYWAKISKVYFANTAKDAAKIGFDDQFIYDAIKGNKQTQQLNMEQVGRDYCIRAMDEWEKKENKVRY